MEPISFDNIEFKTPAIPSVIDLDWGKIGVLKTPTFPIPSFINLPDCNKPLPPITIGHPPLCISKASVPSQITVQQVDIPQISCICLIQSPGTTFEEWLDAKRNVGMHISLEEKCRLIVERAAGEVDNFETFVDQVYESIKMQPRSSDFKPTDDPSVERE